MKDRHRRGQSVIHPHDAEIRFRVKTTIISISDGWIALHTPQRLPVGEPVEIGIGFIDGEKQRQTETVVGNVRWCRTRGHGFAVCIEYKDPDPELHPTFIAYLKQIKMSG